MGRSKKIGITFVCLLLSCGYSYAFQDSIYTLKQCIETAIGNNLFLQQKGLEKEKKQYGIIANRAKLLPVIKAYGNFTNQVDKSTSLSLSNPLGGHPVEGQNYNESRGMRYNTNGGLQLNMPLYNHTLYTSIHIAKQMEEISRMSYDKAIEDLMVTTAEIYYSAQTSLEQRALVEENVHRLSELRDITLAGYENGIAMEVDVNRVDVNLENMKVQLINTQSVYEQQLNLLKYIMGISMETVLIVERPNIDVEKATVLDQGLSDYLFEFKILEAQQRTLAMQRKVILQGYLPTFSLVSQLGYTNYSNHFNRIFRASDTKKWYNSFYWGVSLNVPIFDGFEKNVKLRKNKVEQMQKQIELSDLKQKLTTDYVNGLNQYQNNQRNYIKQKDNYRLAEKLYEVTLDQYREGVASMTALLQDELSMSNAMNNYLNAYHNYKLSELKLLKLSKQLPLLTE